MGFGSKSSSPAPTPDPEPTYKQVETTNDPQERETLGVRRMERFQTRDAPSSNMLEPEAGYGDPAASGTPASSRKSKPGRARMFY